MGSAYGSDVDYGDSEDDEDDFDENSGDDENESGNDDDGYEDDPFSDDITKPFNEEARLAGAEYAHLFIKKSAEQDMYQRAPSPWYGVDDKDEVAYPKNRHDDPRDVDEDAGFVFLTKGTVVFINPFDDYQQSPEKPEPLLLKENSEFLVIRDDERCRWVDILASCYGYCAVPRELVNRFVPKPATGTSRSLGC